LRQFPQFTTLTGIPIGMSFDDSRGYNKYNDLEIHLERRFAKGLQTQIAYTRASDNVADWYRNEYDSTPTEHPSSPQGLRNDTDVRPNRIVWSLIAELPFGKGRRFLQSGLLSKVTGGWQAAWIYQFQNGPLVSWGN